MTRTSKLLLDVPSAEPALGFGPIARALRDIIVDSDPRFAVGIFGGWGSGKTTLMRAIERALDDDAIVSVSFSAWRYEREEHLVVPLLDAIREELIAWAERHGGDAPAEKTATVIGRVMRSIVAGLTVKVGVPGAIDVSFDANRSLLEGGRLRKAQVDALVPRSFYHASFRALESAFEDFVGERPNRRIVVFIDDLDRCLPENALQVLESMKLFFDLEGFVFVVGLDHDVVEYAIDAKYGAARPAHDGASRLSGAEYIKKVFQLPYRLAPVSVDQLADFLAATYRDAHLPAAQQHELQAVVGPHLRHLVGLSAVNPRELKRYINLFILQMQVDETLDPDVVLTLQTIAFRDDWARLKDDILEFREEFLDLVNRRMETAGMPTLDVELDEEIGPVPDEFLDYVRSGSPGNALMNEWNLDRYLLSGEAVRSTRDPALLNALRDLGQVRQLLRAPEAELPSHVDEIVTRLQAIESRVAAAAGSSPAGRTVLDALSWLRRQVDEDLRLRTPITAGPRLQEGALELSRRLRRLYRSGDVGAAAAVGSTAVAHERVVRLDTEPPREVRLAERPVGRGGQAAVFPVLEESDVVVKLYYVPDDDLARRLSSMTALASPEDFEHPAGRPLLAWPTATVLDMETGRVIGYAMRRLAAPAQRPLGALFFPAQRRALFAGRTWRFLLTAAQNLAALVATAHERGILIADLSDQNLVVHSDGHVTALDCDSMEFVDQRTGERFPGLVVTVQYAAPELLEGSNVPRSRSTDAFALAVLVCRLLLLGDHPYMGVPANSPEDYDGGVAENIRLGLTYLSDPGAVSLPAGTVAADVLPPGVHELAQRAFGAPGERPSAAQWVDALQGAMDSVVQCRSNPKHAYGDHLASCPWCARVAAGHPDPFA